MSRLLSPPRHRKDKSKNKRDNAMCIVCTLLARRRKVRACRKAKKRTKIIASTIKKDETAGMSFEFLIPSCYDRRSREGGEEKEEEKIVSQPGMQ